MAGNLLKFIMDFQKTGTGDTQAAGGLKAVGQKANDLVQGLTGLNLSQLSVVGSMVAIGNKAKEVVTEYQSYALEMGKAAKLSGITAEEMSRLTQAADDVRVSQETLTSAFNMALKNGFTPTIENLAVLSDELLAIEDPAKRAARANEIFGRGWAEISEFVLMGGDAIRESTAAIADGMIVTDDAVGAAKDLYAAQDALADSATALGNTFAQKLVPTLTVGLTTLNLLITRSQTLNSAFKQHIGTLGTSGASYETYRAELERTAEIVGARISQEGEYEAYLLRTGEKIRVMSEAEWEAQEAAAESDRALQGMANTLETQVIPSAENATPAIEGVGNAAYTATDIMRDYTAELLFNLAAADLDAEAALNLAKQMGLVDSSTEIAYSKTAEFKEALATGAITADEYTAKILALQGALDRLQDKTINVTMNVNSNYAFGASDSELPGVTRPGPVRETDANGTPGWRTVPPGYPNDSFMVGLSSGETYNVTNDRQRATGAAPSEGVVIQFTGAIIVDSEANYQKTLRRLSQDLTQAMRR